MDQQYGDVTVTLGDDFVAFVELHRPPDNYFDLTLIRSLADAYQALDADPRCRAIVLCAEGKHFCAGASLGGDDNGLGGGPGALYREAIRLFEAGKPVVATQFPHATEVLAGGAGLLVPHRDPAAIAAALRSVATRAEVRAAMAGAAASTAPPRCSASTAPRTVSAAEPAFSVATSMCR